jgi:hypothetical protein
LEVASQANDGTMQNAEHWRHSTRECEDWTVYVRPGKYNHGEVNTTACDVSHAYTALQ